MIRLLVTASNLAMLIWAICVIIHSVFMPGGEPATLQLILGLVILIAARSEKD